MGGEPKSWVTTRISSRLLTVRSSAREGRLSVRGRGHALLRREQQARAGQVRAIPAVHSTSSPAPRRTWIRAGPAHATCVTRTSRAWTSTAATRTCRTQPIDLAGPRGARLVKPSLGTCGSGTTAQVTGSTRRGLRSSVEASLPLIGHTSIAAACRHHARDATRALETLGLDPA